MTRDPIYISIFCTRRLGSITHATAMREYRDVERPPGSTSRQVINRIVHDMESELPGWTVSVQQLTEYEITIAREKLNQQSGL